MNAFEHDSIRELKAVGEAERLEMIVSDGEGEGGITAVDVVTRWPALTGLMRNHKGGEFVASLFFYGVYFFIFMIFI